MIDENYVNRILLDNCGVDDKNFAKILKGISKMQDFKSIIYIKN